ncbi:MAG: hypothetical protein EZS28_037614 [Streblomastix strix]|uniref:Uncharacterized protein n=1 Tax=Streblomastix strix TaxID=222440 RepID=A0A5J4U9H7_9EUKA|nr:MAG: hypothetical protein EZS28_037614 [Streblomastix strix]
MKPKCVDYLRGTVSKAEGRFGMFGTFHIVNYFFGSEVFLSSDGIIIASATDGFGNERKCLLSPIDPKWFGNEKIVQINKCIWSGDVTESGRVYILPGASNHYNDFIERFTRPEKVLQLPFKVDELETQIIAGIVNYSVLRSDGKLFSIRLRDKTISDITDYVTQLAKRNSDEPDMKILNYLRIGMKSIFLLE